MRHAKLIPVFSAILPLIAACGSNPSEAGGSSPVVDQTAIANGSMISRTMVKFQQDGTQVVTQDFITREAQLQELATAQLRRQALAKGEVIHTLTQDTSCGDSDVWLFTGSGETGSELCFYDPSSGWDYADLANSAYDYYACFLVDGHRECGDHPWYASGADGGSAVQSYYSWDDDGCFATSDSNQYSSSSNYVNFDASEEYSSNPDFEYILLNTTCTTIG